MSTQPLFDIIDRDERSRMTWQPKAPPCLDGFDEVFVDCEATGLKWWDGDLPVGASICWGNEDDGWHSQYLPWAHKGGGNLDENVCKRWFSTELRGKRITNLNTKFDIHNFYQWGVDLEAQGCSLGDVSHYAALLDDHRKQFSLERLSQDYLGKGKKKTTTRGHVLDPKKMAEYHAGEVEAYAREDVHLVRELQDIMWPRLMQEDLLDVVDLEDEVTWAVCEMERNAAPMDLELLEQWVGEIDQAIKRAQYDLLRDVGMAVNPKSPNDVRKLFYKLELPIDTTPSGQMKTSTEFLETFDHPILNRVIKIQYMKDLQNKYVDPYWEMARETGLLRFNLHQLRTDNTDSGGMKGAVSGRFSSTEKNIQQVPKVKKHIERWGPDGPFMIRKLFKPARGQILFSSDAAQIEYRLFAHYSESKKILAEYEKNPEVSYHEIVHDMLRPFVPDIPYYQVKNLNFAKLYGAGIKKVAEMLGISRREAKKFVRIYDREFPEVAPLLQRASDVAERRGYVKTILGRRARFPTAQRLHSAVNRIIQGSAADIMKRKLIELFKERKRLGITLRLTVHDEVVGDAPDMETVGKVREVLNRQSFNTKVPILWEINTGANWAEAA